MVGKYLWPRLSCLRVSATMFTFSSLAFIARMIFPSHHPSFPFLSLASVVRRFSQRVKVDNVHTFFSASLLCIYILSKWKIVSASSAYFSFPLHRRRFCFPFNQACVLLFCFSTINIVNAFIYGAFRRQKHKVGLLWSSEKRENYVSWFKVNKSPRTRTWCCIREGKCIYSQGK